MPKCHDDEISALSVSAFGTCFATFRKPSSIMQSFVIPSSLATKELRSKSRNTKLYATSRKHWIYEKLHYTPTAQRRELHEPSVILRRWRLVQNNSILCRCVSFLRNVIFIALATATTAIMIYEAGSGVEKEASHESHEVSVTALPKMPPPDNFEPSRGCLLSVLYLQLWKFISLYLCLWYPTGELSMLLLNCVYIYQVLFVFLISCNSCIKLVGMTEEGCTNQRLRCARRSDMSEYLVLCPPLLPTSFANLHGRSRRGNAQKIWTFHKLLFPISSNCSLRLTWWGGKGAAKKTTCICRWHTMWFNAKRLPKTLKQQNCWFYHVMWAPKLRHCPK